MDVKPMRKEPEETGQEIHNRVKAAHLGWGRVDPPDLADAILLEALRLHGSLPVDELHVRIAQLGERRDYPLFDIARWHVLCRIEDLVDRKLIRPLKGDRYDLTPTGAGLYGEGNLQPQRSQRHAADMQVHRRLHEPKQREE
jgi:hypothetical protein